MRLRSLFVATRPLFWVIKDERRKLLAKEARTVKRLIRQYKLARTAIEGDLSALVKRLAQAQAGGEPISAAWLERQVRYQALLNTIDAEMSRYGLRAGNAVLGRKEEALGEGLAAAGRLAESAGIGGSFASLNPQAFQASVSLFADGSPVRNLFRTYGAGAIRAAQDAFTTGMARGENPRKIARRLMQEIQDLTLHRATRIARNEAVRVYTHAQQESYAANADVIAGSMIVCARDSRTCLMCWAQDGKILQHGESFHRHVGCRCALAPIPRFVDIPKRNTGAEAFKALSRAEQLKILGPTRLAMYEGGTPLSAMYKQTNDLNWGPGLRMLAAKQIDSPVLVLTPPPEKRRGVQVNKLAQKFSLTMKESGSKSVRDAVKEALGVMEDVIGTPKIGFLPPCPLTKRHSKVAAGHFAFKEVPKGSGNWKVRELNISPAAPRKQLTFFHEYGHFIDLCHSGVIGDAMHRSSLPKVEEAWESFSDAVLATPQLKALTTGRLFEALNEAGDSLGFGVEVYYKGNVMQIPVKHARYLAMEEEVWARAFAQYVAQNSNNQKIQDQVTELSLSQSPWESILQWTEEEFAPVAEAVEQVLTTLGFKLPKKTT